jgi:non-specific protein-tyrosine kinase
MELKQVIKTIQRWWWLILAGTIAAGAISYLATRATPYSYLSNTTLLVGQTFRNANVTEGDIGTSQTLADVYASSAVREPVLAGTLKALNLDWSWEALRERVSTRVPQNLPVIEISVVDTDPARAQQFAGAIAEQIIAQSAAAENSASQDRQFTRAQISDLRAKITAAQKQVHVLDDELSKASSARDLAERRSRIDALNVQISTWQQTYATLERNLLEGSPNVITLYEKASFPSAPIGPKLTQNVLLASLVGLVISLVISFALEAIDDSVKSVEDARRASGLSVLGSVAYIRGQGYPNKLVTLRNDNNRAAEAYRVLRTNLQFSVMGKPFQTLMVTSARSREGKSITAANLAMALAQSGRKTALVDCDLRRPTLHEIFQISAENGLTSLFLDESLSVRGGTAEKHRNLTVIPAGPMPHNPAELLDSVRMTQVMDQLKAQFEVVVLDAPPVLSVADATIIGARSDAVLLVVDCGYTRRAQLKRAKEALLAVGARILGVAVNRVSEDSEDDYYFAHTTRRKGGGKRLLLKPQAAATGSAAKTD